MIVYGKRRFGTCDVVGGLCCVETQFFHIWFVPLIPLKSFVLVAGEPSRGVAIPMSGRSLLFAWGRTALVVSLLGLLAGAFVSFGHRSVGGAAVMLLVAGGCGALFALSVKRWSQASVPRMGELIKALVGVAPDRVGRFFAELRPRLDPGAFANLVTLSGASALVRLDGDAGAPPAGQPPQVWPQQQGWPQQQAPQQQGWPQQAGQPPQGYDPRRRGG